MKKILFFLYSFFFINICVLAQPPGQEEKYDWPCIQIPIEELSWGSIWTGPPLDKKTAKWKENEELRLLASKIMNRKTKEEDGIRLFFMFIVYRFCNKASISVQQYFDLPCTTDKQIYSRMV